MPDRTYGTPVGVAGGPSEKPSGAGDRKKAKPATDAQVHAAVKAADDAWRHGREAKPRTSDSARASSASAAAQAPNKGIWRVEQELKKAEKGE